MPYLNRFAQLAALTLVGGCGGEEVAPPSFIEGCQTPVTLLVDITSSPRFTWTPTCTVHELAVWRCPGSVCTGVGDVLIWSTGSRADNRLTSGIIFGEAPASADTETPQVESLEAGAAYLVRLSVWQGADEPTVMRGERPFSLTAHD